MSYTKLEFYYLGDEGRESLKRKVISLPKVVQEFGDKYGYNELTVSYSGDRIIIKHHNRILMDKDFNGSSIEYIQNLLIYEWIGDDGSRFNPNIVETNKSAKTYSKLEIHYIGDEGRETPKRKIISIPQNIQEFAIRCGYDKLKVSYSCDYIYIKYGNVTLIEKDINGSSIEYIRNLLSYEWIADDGSRFNPNPIETKKGVKTCSILNIHYVNYSGEARYLNVKLSKNVQEYGNNYGYETLTISHSSTSITISHKGVKLMEREVLSWEASGIKSITSLDWIGEDGVQSESKTVEEKETNVDEMKKDVEPVAEVKTEENVNLVEEIEEEVTDEFIEKNEDNGYVDGYLVYSDDTKTTLLTCSTAVTGEIIIPNSVVSIGEYAFRDCKSLSSVTIPNSVTSIGDRAFWECSALTSVVIPNSITSIGASAFSYCSSLTSVHITDLAAWFGISFRGNASNPLYYAHNLYLKGELIKELVIPNSVTNIGQYAFEGCSSLTSITIHNSVISIGRNAFSDCSGLMSVTIPNSVTSIGKDAFYRCSSLTSITIPNSVTSIGDYTFAECNSLTSITIPNSVISIGSWAFYICKSLTFITIPNSVTSIGEDAFALCFKLTSITIPNSVTSIGKGAFRSCDALTSVTIENEEGKVVIGKEAFPSTAKINYVGKPKEQPAKPAEKEIAQAKPEAPKATTQANPSLLAKLLKIVKSIFHSTNKK